MGESMLEQTLTRGFSELGLPLGADALARYRVYFDALERGNAVMNLTAIEGEDEVARLHFLDSAALLCLEPLEGKRVIDVGTGAGFPGLALKIACPEMALTLLDSLDKRVAFLRETCAELGFGDVACVHARAEEMPEGFRESFDCAVSRAVARFNVLCELCLPYVMPGGRFLAMKGPEADAEIREAYVALKTLGAEVERVFSYRVPGTERTHCAVVIRKTGPTPKKYPRRWAQIKKKPL